MFRVGVGERCDSLPTKFGEDVLDNVAVDFLPDSCPMECVAEYFIQQVVSKVYYIIFRNLVVTGFAKS